MTQRSRAVPTAGLLTFVVVSNLVAQEAQPPEPGPPPEPAPQTEAQTPPAATRAAAEVDAAIDAELADATDRPYWRTNLFKRFFSDQKYMFTTWWPSEFRRFQFTGPLLGGVALAAAHGDSRDEAPDVEFQHYVQAESDEHSAGGAAHLFSFIGNAGPAAILLGAGYLIGRWGHQDRLAEASSLSAEALLTSGLYCTVLKRLTARTRPSGGSDGQFFTYNPGPGEVVGSFPSGHATGAFTVATVFAETYKDHPWVAWVSYGAAGMVGWSRLAKGRHFAGDVIVGGLLGHSVGRMVTTRGREGREAAFEVEPFFDPSGEGAGVMVSRRW